MVKLARSTREQARSLGMKGYGRCIRMTGKSFRSIVQTKSGSHVTFDLHMDASSVGLQEDEVFRVAVQLEKGIPSLVFYDRQTLYNKFKDCVDESVELKLCICDKRTPLNDAVRRMDSKEIRNVVVNSMFGSKSFLKNICNKNRRVVLPDLKVLRFKSELWEMDDSKPAIYYEQLNDGDNSRWLAIRKPNLYRRAFTLRRVILFTAMIWAYTLISTGILYNIPSITRIPRGRFMVAQLGLAMVFIMISQIHVYISIKKQFKTGVHPSNGQKQREALIERNVAIVVIYVVIGVAVSHVPNFILKLSTNSYYSLTSCWLNLLLLANAVANPIIWLKTNGKLRRTVLKIFKAWSHCREPDLFANSS
ncbi:hypothetical protein QZH41_004899 [Actinostola sp. cb2023]|nr:hypothetical protein QZH41_004899 [Actinostola sp. cb2023]